MPALLLGLGLFMAACDTSSPGSTPPEEGGPRAYEFESTNNETFIAITSDPDVIAAANAQLTLPEDERKKFILGDIARGDGGHNEGYPWHFVENEWTLVEAAVEVCDGRPSRIEDDLDYWVDTLGYFCPWNSHVLREVDVPAPQMP